VRGNSPFSSIVKETSWWSSSAWIGREASKGSNSVVGLFGVGGFKSRSDKGIYITYPSPLPYIRPKFVPDKITLVQTHISIDLKSINEVVICTVHVHPKGY
jgi:hypothetical protein